MRLFITSFLTVVLLASCAVKSIPLKGNYPAPPFEAKSERDFETVWSKSIDFFAQSGVGIKTIDKSSGIIIAQKSAMFVTPETREGKPKDSLAWVSLRGAGGGLEKIV